MTKKRMSLDMLANGFSNDKITNDTEHVRKKALVMSKITNVTGHANEGL